ncbi:MAG: 7-carboxy-7-deazaguanine synthase QueE [Candidatus Omnitrophota bacterium]
MIKAKISEIFKSIQGEGVYAGIPQVFIRFHGCCINCDFCDTRNLSFKEYSLGSLIKEINKFKHSYHSLALTGGEPLMHKDFLREVLPLLKKYKRTIYLETNGTLPESLKEIIKYIDIIAMDFKLPSSTKRNSFWREHSEFLSIAATKNVFTKAVICSTTKFSDLITAIEILKENIRHRRTRLGREKNIPLILQPNFHQDEALKKAFLFQDKCLNYWDDVRVIPQLHKYIGAK